MDRNSKENHERARIERVIIFAIQKKRKLQNNLTNKELLRNKFLKKGRGLLREQIGFDVKGGQCRNFKEEQTKPAKERKYQRGYPIIRWNWIDKDDIGFNMFANNIETIVLPADHYIIPTISH